MKNLQKLSRVGWVSLALFMLVVGLAIYVLASRPKGVMDSSTSNQYTKAQPTAFAEQIPEVSLISASATHDTLEFVVSISGLPTAVSYVDVSNWVCDPYIRSGGKIHLTPGEFQITKPHGVIASPFVAAAGEPFEVHYQYNWVTSEPGLEVLPLRIDYTIGPCYPIDFDNVTAVPDIPMIANYVIEIEVPVQ